MPATATCGFVCLAINFADTTFPDCIHERSSSWKTDGNRVVAADDLIVERVSNVLVRVYEISIHEVESVLAHDSPMP